MWFREKLAELTTPRVVRAFTSSGSEEMVTNVLGQEEEKSVRRLNPRIRAVEWSSLGAVDITASYLRRSIMHPSDKRDLLIRTVENRFYVLLGIGDFVGAMKAMTMRDNMLQMQR